jgi:hypothetical protein
LERGGLIVDQSAIRSTRVTLTYTRDLSMSTQRVVVTYSAPQSFISSDQWVQLHDALSAQLPLRNIHWKPQTRPSIRTVQELEVQLVPLNTVRDESTSQVPYSLLEKPLLNIFVVTCEVRLHLTSSFDVLFPRAGQRRLQDYCQKADQRLANIIESSQEPGMGHRTRRTF